MLQRDGVHLSLGLCESTWPWAVRELRSCVLSKTDLRAPRELCVLSRPQAANFESKQSTGGQPRKNLLLGAIKGKLISRERLQDEESADRHFIGTCM